jgi:hypothetical protein
MLFFRITGSAVAENHVWVRTKDSAKFWFYVDMIYFVGGQ